LNHGPTTWDKKGVPLGTSKGTHWDLGNIMGTWWEHIGNKPHKKSFPPSPSQRKQLSPPLQLSHWLHEILISKTTIFNIINWGYLFHVHCGTHYFGAGLGWVDWSFSVLRCEAGCESCLLCMLQGRK
jgi:hypothetical protein